MLPPKSQLAFGINWELWRSFETKLNSRHVMGRPLTCCPRGHRPRVVGNEVSDEQLRQEHVRRRRRVVWSRRSGDSDHGRIRKWSWMKKKCKQNERMWTQNGEHGGGCSPILKLKTFGKYWKFGTRGNWTHNLPAAGKCSRRSFFLVTACQRLKWSQKNTFAVAITYVRMTPSWTRRSGRLPRRSTRIWDEETWEQKKEISTMNARTRKKWANASVLVSNYQWSTGTKNHKIRGRIHELELFHEHRASLKWPNDKIREKKRYH